MHYLTWEARKHPARPWTLLLVLCAMLLLNGYAESRATLDMSTMGSESYLAAFDEVYSRVEGEITLENMQWVISEYSRLSAQIQSGQFSTEEDWENTYTGYTFQDSILFEQLYADAKYAYEYGIHAAQIASAAADNARYYAERQNAALSGRYTAMADIYAQRQIGDFYRTEGWADYAAYEFSNLLILLLVLLGLSPLFAMEWDTGTKQLLQVTPRGSTLARHGKLLLAAVYVWAVTTLFSAQDYLWFSRFYGFRGLGNPLYAIQEFSHTALNIRIWQFLALNYAARLLGVGVFSAQVLLLSAAVRSNLSAFGGGAALLVLQVAADAFCARASVLPLLNIAELCEDFTGNTLLGVFLPEVFQQILVQGLLGAACIALLCRLDRVGFSGRRKERVYVPADQMAD